MDLDIRRVVDFIETNVDDIEDEVMLSDLRRSDYVRLFGVTDWLYCLLQKASGDDDWRFIELSNRLRRIQAGIYEETVIPDLADVCVCGEIHDDLRDFYTAFRDSHPLLMMQQSESGKTYFAYQFLMKVNQSMAIELSGRIKRQGYDGVNYSVVRFSAADLWEAMCGRDGPSPVKGYVKRHIDGLVEWAKGMDNLDAPHIIRFANRYRKWSAPELAWVNLGVDSKWDQHIPECEGRVTNFHIGNYGYMYRCYLCCYEEGCRYANSVAAAQAEG